MIMECTRCNYSSNSSILFEIHLLFARHNYLIWNKISKKDSRYKKRHKLPYYRCKACKRLVRSLPYHVRTCMYINIVDFPIEDKFEIKFAKKHFDYVGYFYK